MTSRAKFSSNALSTFTTESLTGRNYAGMTRNADTTPSKIQKKVCPYCFRKVQLKFAHTEAECNRKKKDSASQFANLASGAPSHYPDHVQAFHVRVGDSPEVDELKRSSLAARVSTLTSTSTARKTSSLPAIRMRTSLPRENVTQI